METIKLDISKTGIAVSAEMQAKHRPPTPCSNRAKARATTSSAGYTSRRRSRRQKSKPSKTSRETPRKRPRSSSASASGGSYLGAKAVLEAMSDPFRFLHKEQTAPVVLFAGQNISEDYTYELLEAVKEHSIATIVISKSGTTTEPAIAFRLIKAEIEKALRQKREAAERIVAITDKARGALKTLATNGVSDVRHPDDVGGRFSVLTPVGCCPGRRRRRHRGTGARCAGDGACDGRRRPFGQNPAAVYAAVRNELYNGGKKVEILGSYEPKLQYINEWWKQLYGESEGKQGKGIFPASVTLTADLHSMGQYIQDGERTLFRNDHFGCQTRPRGGYRGRGRKPRRPQLPRRETHFGGQPHGRAGRAAGTRRRRGAQHPHRNPRNRRTRHRFAALLLREGLRHQRLHPRRKPVRPARRGGVQRKTCSPCWTSRATRRHRKPSKHGCKQPRIMEMRNLARVRD